MNDVIVTVTGNVCHDVRHVVTEQGTHIASFRLASTPRRFDRHEGRWVDGETNYLTVTCWRHLAENVASSLGKGDPVIVVGRLQVRNWERDGMRGRSVEIDATAVGHDLTRGTSAFRRVNRFLARDRDGVDALAAEFETVTAENQALAGQNPEASEETEALAA